MKRSLSYEEDLVPIATLLTAEANTQGNENQDKVCCSELISLFKNCIYLLICLKNYNIDKTLFQLGVDKETY